MDTTVLSQEFPIKIVISIVILIVAALLAILLIFSFNNTGKNSWGQIDSFLNPTGASPQTDDVNVNNRVHEIPSVAGEAFVFHANKAAANPLNYL